MSIFDGRIREFPDVFVDNFSSSFLNARRNQAFFLSHAHSDHMRGLDSPAFQAKFLAHPRAIFVASNETKELLLRQEKFKAIAAVISAKPANETFAISLGQEHDELADPKTNDENGVEKDWRVLVTLLPAQHCPGSVSIYFLGKCLFCLFLFGFFVQPAKN